MRKRELQSITLKLSELNEYDYVKIERTLAKTDEKPGSTEKEDGKQSPIANVGPKTSKEINDRLNTTM
ncbi:uncharacterized protein LOC119670484 [Teleopsis dalmanni]|uniref:uncharacterized protein LOC119670484 n=1 Tax=Teleopsis dalmanni TaxID=139649 RepID=UPI0018CDBC74|nr:uncharacterized protein LOC119670484 [Teleopsis dalmanni]